MIGDLKRLTHPNLSDFYFSTNLTPQVFLALGNTQAERKSAYQSLFLSHLSDNTIQAIRDATNKAWALGDDSFIEQVANTLSRRAKPLPQGGDRRSKAFNSSKPK